MTARDLNLLKAVTVDDHKHTGPFDPDNKSSRFPVTSANPFAIPRCRIQERINLCCHKSTAVSVAYSLFCITQAQVDPVEFPTSRIAGYSTDVTLSSRVILLARLLVDIMNQLFSIH